MFYPQKDHCLALPQPGTDLRSSSSPFLDPSLHPLTASSTLSLEPLLSTLSLGHSDQPHGLFVGDLWFPNPKHKPWRPQARVEVSSFQEPACALESSAKVLPVLPCEGVLLLESWEVPALVPLQSSLLWPGLRGSRHSWIRPPTPPISTTSSG